MLDDPITTKRTITKALNIHGWSHLDGVLLAALAIEAPLLLIGPHGTGKTQLVERVARALGLEMRHYNASLLNYDDLVGIPMPDKEGKSLSFIESPGTIWGAGFVFFDEISRCRADLQNKLFPIIHERRVVGIPLENLLYRWAAMNPPAPDEPDPKNSVANYYFGSEPLDPALTDRFPFVVPVPDWPELDKEDRYRLVAWQNGHHEDEITLDLMPLVEETAALIPQVEAAFQSWVGDYILYLVDLLEQSQLPQSPRRAWMLARSVAAVHAARMVLEGEDVDPEESAELALIYGMPQSATEVPPSQVKLIGLHRQAWEMKEYIEDDNWRRVMEEFDLARRVVLADQLGFDDEDMSRLVTQTISAEDSDARQIGLATAMFLAFQDRRELDPSAYEPVAQLAYHVLEPRVYSANVNNNTPDMTLWNEIVAWVNEQHYREDTYLYRLERNYLMYGFPKLWRNHNWKESLEQFKKDLSMFGIEESEE